MQKILGTASYLSNSFMTNCMKNLLRYASNKNANFYTVLGLEPRASDDKVKNAYYELSKRYHPDKNIGDESATQKILEINEAFEVLGNKVEKVKYDNMFFPSKKSNKFHFIYEHNEYYEQPFTDESTSRIYRKKNPAADLKYEQYRKHLRGTIKRKSRHMAQKYEFHKNSGAKLFSSFKAKS